MNRSIFLGALTLTMVLLQGGSGAAVQGATVYNFEDDFSDVNDENSIWSYRFKEGSDRNGDYTLLSVWDADGARWGEPGIDPHIGVGFDAHLHPGPIHLVVVTWTAPGDGWVDLEYEFTRGDSGGDGVHWYVDHGIDNLQNASLPGPGGSSGGTYENLWVNVGDQIHFIIDPLDTYYHDSMMLFAEVAFTAVPEPSTAALGLLPLGGFGVALLWRRRRERSNRLE